MTGLKGEESDASEYQPDAGEDSDEEYSNSEIHSENGQDSVSDEGEVPTRMAKPELQTCKVCGKQYQKPGLYLKHLQSHGLPEEDSALQEAMRLAEARAIASGHRAAYHTDEDSKVRSGATLLQCPHCPKTFERRWNYERHMIIHMKDSEEDGSGEDKKEIVLQCPDCDRVFSRTASLTRHRMTQHGLKPNSQQPNQQDSAQQIAEGVQCPICGHWFKRQELLDKHLANHARGEVFICEACGKMFSRQSLFEKHIKRHERGVEFDYSCAVCGKGFNKAGLYRRHMEDMHSHMQVTDPRQCKLCKQRFQDENALREHHCQMSEALQKTQDSWACPICPKVFKSQYHLDAHVRMHQGERPFVCEICGKSFTRSDVMRVHMRVHSEVKEFQCEVCGQGFRSKFHLSRHMNTHLEKTEVYCEFCGQVFYRLDYFNQHLKKAHIGNLPPPTAPSAQGESKGMKKTRSAGKKGKKGDGYKFIVTDSEGDDDEIREEDQAVTSNEDPETSSEFGEEEVHEGESEC